MEDLYSFGKTKYIPADPLQRSVFSFVKNVVIVLFATVKCTVLGIFIIAKSLLLLFVPSFPKDIQNQVALVRNLTVLYDCFANELHFITFFIDHWGCKWDWPCHWH